LKSAVAPFEKGGGDRAADAGGFAFDLAVVVEEAKQKQIPLAPLFQRGELVLESAGA
jgi:hypothetical protein